MDEPVRRPPQIGAGRCDTLKLARAAVIVYGESRTAEDATEEDEEADRRAQALSGGDIP
jgi:hypothetical protein